MSVLIVVDEAYNNVELPQRDTNDHLCVNYETHYILLTIIVWYRLITSSMIYGSIVMWHKANLPSIL